MSLAFVCASLPGRLMRRGLALSASTEKGTSFLFGTRKTHRVLGPDEAVATSMPAQHVAVTWVDGVL